MNLSSDLLVLKFAFKFNLYRYTVDKFGPTEAAHTRTVFSVVARGGTVMTTSLDRTLSAWQGLTHVRGSSSNVPPPFCFFQSVLSVSPFFNSNLCAQGYSDNLHRYVVGRRQLPPRVGYDGPRGEGLYKLTRSFETN